MVHAGSWMLNWLNARLDSGPWPLRPWLALALVLRLGMCAAYVLLDARGLVPLASATFDAAGTDGYLQIARTLLDHGVFGFGPELPAHHRPPLTSLLMLAAVWDAEQWWQWWFALTSVMGVAVVWLGASLAQMLDWPARTRNLLVLALVLHPYLVLPARTTTFLPVGIVVAMLLLFAVARVQVRATIWRAVAVGAALALCLLTHASLLVLLPVAALAVWGASGRAPHTRVRHLALALLTTALLIAPWTLRNAATFHRFIPIADGAGYQYWKGEESAFANRDAGERTYSAHTGDSLRVVHWGTESPRQDSLLWALGLRHAAADLPHLAQRVVIGAAMFWAPWEAGWAKALVCALLNLPLLILATILLIRRPPRDTLDAFAVGMVVLLWAGFAFFAANTTYFPLVLPALLLLVVRRL
jgi:hypothetical protein